MKHRAAIALVLSAPLLLVAAVWQAGRYAALAAEARRLEAAQEEWIEQNKKLLASIAVLSSRERAASLAAELGLEKAGPSRRLIVVPSRGNRGGSDG
ncbi:MAG TPA: cell division protein FtsL [Spirochaetia bacterium]|nr:cell division protein FtsL [Spirochaetales bacterium]HRY72241.1 cell division protein FtsL [Spirochaetia bacterium]